jgi:nitrate reductase cytochrome c-type subunit
MIKLLRELLLVIAMLGMVSAGAVAQRKDQDKRPPKEPAKVITNDRKDQRPPRQNPNQPPPKRDKRERPD